MRVAQELMLRGVQVSSGGVRGVWQRHALLTKHERLLRLERATAERKLSLTDDQVRLLERFSPEFRERHIEAPHTGALLAVDTFFVGVLKGVGKIYLQTAIDCASRYAWARLYPNKLPVTAVQLLNNDVLPTFEQHGAAIDAVLSDNGREFCGREDQHPYELFLQLEGIVHKRTRVSRPQSNGIVERLHRTLLDEHFRVEGRKTWFETIEEMQMVLDEYLVGYNTRRPQTRVESIERDARRSRCSTQVSCQGYNDKEAAAPRDVGMNGRTPLRGGSSSGDNRQGTTKGGSLQAPMQSADADPVRPEVELLSR